jgi:hypothetical protein
MNTMNRSFTTNQFFNTMSKSTKRMTNPRSVAFLSSFALLPILIALFSPRHRAVEVMTASEMEVFSTSALTSSGGCYSMEFDGTATILTVGDNASLAIGGNDDIKVSARVKLSSTGTTQMIMSKRLSGAGVDEGGGVGGNIPGFQVTVNNSGNLGAAIDDGPTVISATGSANLFDGNWHSVEAFFDRDGNLSLTVDGSPDGSAVDISAFDGISLTNAEELSIGNDDDDSDIMGNGPYPSMGLIDDIVLEIGGSTVVAYDFEDGMDAPVTDGSGNGNDATLTAGGGGLFSNGCGAFDLSGTTLTFTGTSDADDLTITCSGGDLLITDNNSNPLDASNIPGSMGSGTSTVTIPIGSIDQVVFDMGDGDDDLTVSLPCTGVDITVNGGGQATAAGDALEVSGGTGDQTVNFTGEDSGGAGTGFDGNLDINGSTITFTGLEPLTLGGSAANLIINLPNANNNDATLQNSANAGEIEIVGSTFENTVFPNPSSSLTINGGSQNDYITIDDLDAGFDASLTVNTNVERITVTANNISLSGTNAIDLEALQFVDINGSADITTASGSISIGGNTSGAYTSNSDANINISGGNIVTTNGGNIIFNSIGSGGTNSKRGIWLRNSASVSTTTGTITMTGTGAGAAAGTNSAGIEINNSSVSTGSGAIEMNGTAIATGSGSEGIRMLSNGAISSTSGNITINADKAILDAGTVSSSGALTIQPLTNGGTIGLGTGAGTLQLSNTELGNLQNGFSSVTIGNSMAGNITLNTAVFNDDPVILSTGSNITDNNASGTDLTAPSGATANGSVVPGASPGVLEVSGGLTIPSGAALNIEIAGTAGAGLAGGHDQVRVTSGDVDVNGATLNISVLAAPIVLSGTDYMIVENVGGTTTSEFDGLPEGTVFNVSGVQFTITYVGGVGSNDVILSACDPPVINDIETTSGTTLTCSGPDDGITLELTGNLGSSQSLVWSTDPVGAGTFTPAMTPPNTAVFTPTPGWADGFPAGRNVDITAFYTRADGCTATSTKTFTIYPEIQPFVGIENSAPLSLAGNVCTGSSVNVEAQPAGGLADPTPDANEYDEYFYQWEIIALPGSEPGPAGPLGDAVLTNASQRVATFFPDPTADEGDQYALQCTITDDAGCSAVSDPIILTVVGPTEATIAFQPLVIPYLCSGEDAASLLVVDIDGGSPVYTVVLRGRNVGELIDETFTVQVDASGAIITPSPAVQFDNPKLKAIPVTYTIVSVEDMNGCELVAPGGITGSVSIFYDPVPSATATAQNAVICSGDNAVINLETDRDLGLMGYKWVADGDAGSSNSGAANLGFTGPMSGPYTSSFSDGPLTNNTDDDIVVTYTITPYTYGANGVDNGGTGDDCLLDPALTVDVTVEPEPAATATAQDAVICSGDNAVIDVTTTVNEPMSFKWTADGDAGSSTTGADMVALGTGVINDGVLTNNTDDDIVVTYTITPYTYGPDGIDDGGTNDDCLLDPALTVDVTVEPYPAATATAQNAVICSGSNAVIDVTTTVNEPMSFKWTADGDAGSSIAGADMVALGIGALTDGPLGNNTNADIIVTYTITAYTYGPNGMDDGGTGDDCLISPALTVDITVEPGPTATATAQNPVICSGSNAVIDVTTTILEPMSFKWSADGDAGSNATGLDMVALGTGAINDGALTNNTDDDIIVTYTITPYTFGPNGTDDGGTLDDCLLSPALTVDVTVEPEPAATATAQNAVICSGDNAVIDVITTVNEPMRFKWSADGDAGSNATGLDMVALGTGAINDGALANNTDDDIIVTYTITPYTFGPNGTDDGGTGDDCLLSPALTVDVTVEPEPAATATAQNAVICSGDNAVIDVTTTVNEPMSFKWSADGDAGSNATGLDMVALGTGVIDDGALTNNTNDDIIVTYTITPYTFGPNGTDDGGTGDDCMLDPALTVDITVEPEPKKTVAATPDRICSGANGVIDVTTSLTTSNTAFKWSANYGTLTGTGAGSDDMVGFGAGAIDDGPLVNSGDADVTVTYTITAYTFGPNGTDDGGTLDDCLSAPMDVDIIVEPNPTATADARDDVICSGTNAEIDVETTLTTPDKAFKWEANYGTVSGTLGSPQSSVAFGVGVINDGPLVNNSGADVTVVYTITPYTFGPNGIDDDGTGDDCEGTPQIVNVVVEPTPVATADAQDDIICSGAGVIIDVTTIMTTPKKAFKWVADGDAGSNAGGAAMVAFGPSAITDGPLTNNTNADITVTYTITPYTFGRNGLDNGGTGDDCLGTPITVNIVVEPTPTFDQVVAQNATICSGDNAVVDVTTNLTTPKKAFKWSATYGTVTGGSGSAASVAFGTGAINDGALTNAGTTNETVTYTITPYTFGRNGADNGGTGDDCLGTPQEVDVIVEPEPQASPSAMMQTICHNSAPTITVDVTALDGNNYLVESISNPDNFVGGVSTAPYTRMDGQTIDPGILTNSTSSTQTVTYTIVPYTYGPDGEDDGGDDDDCTGASFEVMVKVEPDPMATPSETAEIICSGTSPTITVDVTAIDGNKYRVESISNLGGILGVGTAPYTRTDGQTIDAGPLTNPTTTSQTVTYTIVPYTYGPDGIDNDGDLLSDDCRGESFTVDVQVDPTPTIAASYVDPTANVVIDAVDLGGNPASHMCSGSPLMVDLTTNVANIRLRWEVTNIGGPSGSIVEYAINDMGSNFFPTAGPNTFTGLGGNVTLNDDVRRNIVFELTPVYDPDGMDNSGDECVGSPLTYRIRVWPTPEISLTGGGVVCSGASTTGLVTSSQTTAFIESGIADGDIAYDISIDPTPGVDELASGLSLTDLNNGFDDGDPSVDISTLTGFPATLTNQTDAPVTFTINVTPKFISDDPNAPKCPGTPQMINVTVEPDPAATASAAMETICHNSSPTITVDVTAINGNNYRVESISNPGSVGGVTAAPYTRADGETVDAGTLTNTTSTVQTVTYTIVPYTYGPDLTDNGGDPMSDDCRGASFTVDVKVEPDPAAEAVDVDANTDPNTETICHEGMVQTTIDVTALNGNNYLVSAALQSGIATGFTEDETKRADGDAIDVQVISNISNAPAVIRYTITPYSYGANGMDEDGGGDDCRGTSFFVDVTVQPDLVTMPGLEVGVMNLAPKVCLGSSITILGNVKYQDGSPVTIGSLSKYSWRYFGGSATNVTFDGVLFPGTPGVNTPVAPEMSANSEDLTISAANPLTQPGTIILQYIVTDAEGCVSDPQVVIVEIDAGNNSGTPAGIGTICADFNGGIYNLGQLINGEDVGGVWSFDPDPPSPQGIGGSLDGNAGTFDMTTVAGGPAVQQFHFRYTVSTPPCAPVFTDVTLSVQPLPDAGVGDNTKVCSDGSASIVNLPNLLTDEDPGGNWTASGSNPMSVTLSDPTMVDFTGKPAGSYFFTYTVGGQGACTGRTDTEQVEVVVVAPPNPGLNGTAVVCNGDLTNTVNLFTSLGGTPQTGGTWNDDDASGGMLVGNVFNAFGVTPGDYTFTYTVPGTDPCPAASATVEVTVKDPPTANDAMLMACDDAFGEPMQATFDLTEAEGDINGGMVTYQYFRNVGLTNVIAVPDAFLGNDEQVVYVKVTDGDGCMNVAELTLDVKPLPQAVDAELTACEETLGAGQASFDLTAAEGDITPGLFTFEYYTNITLTTPVPDETDFTGMEGTIVYVKVIGTNGCENVVELTLHVQPQPNAGNPKPEYATAHATADQCSDEGGAINLFDLLDGTQDGGGQWVKVTTGPNTGTLVGPNFNPQNITGTTPVQLVFTYTVQPTAPCTVADVATVHLTVQPAPDAGVGVPGYVCNNDPAYDLNTLLIGQDPNGTWSKVPPASDAILNPATGILDVTGATPGIYQFQYTVTATDPCNNANSEVLTVEIFPTATAEAGPDKEICSDDPDGILLTGASIGGSAVTGSWSIFSQPVGGNGNLSTTLPLSNVASVSFSASVPGEYVLELTSEDPDGGAPNGGPCEPITDQVTITVDPAVEVDAGPNQMVCEDAPEVTLAGTIGGGASSATWSSSGDGTFSPDANTLTATYTPGATDLFLGAVVLTLTTDDPEGPCGLDSDQMIIQIKQVATVDAGEDQTVCTAEPTVTLAGTIGGSATSATWSGGGGTFDPDDNTLDAVYTPSAAEILAGTVTLTLTTDDPEGPCGAVSDMVTITIDPTVTVDAGVDQTVCADAPAVTLAGVVGGAATSGTWSGGGGTFDPDVNTLTATYTPSAAEIEAGMVTLTLTTNDPDGPCGPESDEMIITIDPIATVDAGEPQTVCSDAPAVTLAGTVGGGATSGMWTGGGGTFDPDANTLDAVYTPSAAEILAGTVTLTLTTNDPDGPCDAVSDMVTITIDPAATVDAGMDQTVCADAPAVTLAGTVGGGATSGTWSGGAGTFDPDANTLDAVYTPSAAEIVAGTVTLTLTTNTPDGPCGPVSDQMTITINATALVDAGGPYEVCSDAPAVSLAGLIGGAATSASWAGGTGIFNPSRNALNAVYTPSPAEINAGTVNLFLISNDPAGPCNPALDQATITITPVPTVNAGIDQTVCADNPSVVLAGSLGGSATGAVWTGGTGVFSPNAGALNATYTPTAAEILAGTVTLTLTTGDPVGACVAVSDQMTITIDPVATADAGEDQTVCADSPVVTLAGTVGGGATSGTWSGGDGTFDPDANTLGATYTPTAGEIANGSVMLTLTTNDPDGPCVAASDVMTIFFESAATADAGPDQTVCSNDPSVVLAGSIGGAATSGTWSGAGTFSPDANTLGATYTPTAAEILAGTATVTLTTNDPGGNCDPATDEMIITINPAATVNAGADVVICSDGTVTLSGSIGGGATSATWSTSGNGVFDGDGTLAGSTTYTPGAVDRAIGLVFLTLTTDDPDGAGPCLPAQDFFRLTILPEPEAETDAVDNMETICTGESPATVISSATAGTVVFDVIALNTVGTVTGFTSVQAGIAEGSTLDPAMLINAGTTQGVVRYIVSPRTAGPDMSLGTTDDCIGDPVIVDVKVDPAPVMNPALAMPAPVCSGSPIGVVLSTEASSVAATSYMVSAVLDAGLTGVPTEGMNVTDVNALAGDVFVNTTLTTQFVTYTVTPQAANGCKGAPFDIVVGIYAKPTVNPSPLEMCINSTETILPNVTGGSGTVTDYKWTYRGGTAAGFTINGIEPAVDAMFLTETIEISTVDIIVAGVIGLRLEVTDDNGCTTLRNFNVTVKAASNSGVADTETICEDVGNFQLASLLSGMPDETGTWTQTGGPAEGTLIGSGFLASFNPAGLTGTDPVTFNFTYTVDDVCPPASTEVTLIVQPTPKAGVFDAMADNVVCTSDGLFDLFTLLEGDAGVDYESTGSWSVVQGQGGVLSGAGNHLFNPAGADPNDDYILRYTVAAELPCTESAFVDVVIDVIPGLTPDFIKAVNFLQVTFSDQSLGGATAWDWDFGDGNTSTQQNPMHTYGAGGSYVVTLTVSNGECTAMTMMNVTVAETGETCDEVVLENGLNLISIDVSPTDKDLYTVFANQIASEKLVLIVGRDNTGAAVLFDPTAPVPELNDLTHIADGHGYFVRMSGGDILTVCGPPIDGDYRRDLNAGLNLIGYVPQTPASPTDYFSELIADNNLVLALGYSSTDGFLLFDPEAPLPELNDLTELVNGAGYILRLNTSTTGVDWRGEVFGNVNSNEFTFIAGKSNLPISMKGEPVYIVTEKGDIAGVMEVIRDGYLKTSAVYGDDPTTPELDGLVEGEKLYFQFRDQLVDVGFTFKSEMKLNILPVEFDLELLKEGNGTSPLEQFTAYPNPFNSLLNIRFTLQEDSDVSLNLFDASGRLIKTFEQKTFLQKGDYAYDWTPVNLKAGVYYVQLVVAGEVRYSQRLFYGQN